MAGSDLADILQNVPKGAERALPRAECDRHLVARRGRMEERGLDLAIIPAPKTISETVLVTDGALRTPNPLPHGPIHA